MFRVAIIDDNEEYINIIESVFKCSMQKQAMEYELKLYKSPIDLECDLNYGKNDYYDLYLMDIEMPAINGLQLAQMIREKYLEPYIIFISTFARYSIDGYKYKAFRYVVKDKLESMLQDALSSVLAEWIDNEEPYYQIENNDVCQKLFYKDIYYIDVQKKYTYFHTINMITRSRCSLKAVYEDLSDKKAFVFSDQNCIVNLKHVMKLDLVKSTIVLRDGTELWVNQSRKKALEKAIHICWGEKA